MASVVFGLLGFIPLLNWGLCILAIYFGIKAIRNIRGDRITYGGMAFAIIGLVLGIAVLFFNITWALFYASFAPFPLDQAAG